MMGLNSPTTKKKNTLICTNNWHSRKQKMFSFNHLRPLGAATLFLALTGIVNAQCGDCGGGSCQGRCHYCVDGECTPNRATYGFYQTNWRKWPVAAPVVPARPKPGSQPQGPLLGPEDLDLPAAEDESEIRPEFPRLREKAGVLPIDFGTFDSYPFGSDKIEDADVNGPETIEMDVGPDVTTPPAEIEDSILLDQNALRRQTETIRQASAIIATRFQSNPLRGSTGSTTAVQTSATVPRPIQSVITAQPLPKVHGQTGNPLR
jgi:hypothetical protein